MQFSLNCIFRWWSSMHLDAWLIISADIIRTYQWHIHIMPRRNYVLVKINSVMSWNVPLRTSVCELIRYSYVHENLEQWSALPAIRCQSPYKVPKRLYLLISATSRPDTEPMLTVGDLGVKNVSWLRKILPIASYGSHNDRKCFKLF